MKNTNRTVRIRANLSDVYGASERWSSLTEFLQFKAQDAVEILQELYGQGMAPTVSIVDYEVVGHEDNDILIDVHFE